MSNRGGKKSNPALRAIVNELPLPPRQLKRPKLSAPRTANGAVATTSSTSSNSVTNSPGGAVGSRIKRPRLNAGVATASSSSSLQTNLSSTPPTRKTNVGRPKKALLTAAAAATTTTGQSSPDITELAAAGTSKQATMTVKVNVKLPAKAVSKPASSSAKIPVSTSSASASTRKSPRSIKPITASKTSVLQTWNGNIIGVEGLKTLDVSREYSTTLLVDCRALEYFNDRKILRFDCVNVFPSPTLNVTAPERFTTKGDMVQFLRNHCSTLLCSLNGPGFYKDIIILDESSTSKSCSATVILMLEFITKWNDNSRTVTRLLEGGFNAVIRQDLSLVEGSSHPHLPWAGAVLHHLEFGVPLVTSGETSNNVIKESVNAHLDNLDLALMLCQDLLTKRKAIKSFTVIKHLLVQEDNELTLDANFVDNLIPDDVKCPVCFEMFTKEVLQCTNGHCICSGCVKTLTICPECRAPYSGKTGGKVRNRMLEKLMGTSLNLECPFRARGCEEKLAYTHLEDHLKLCTFRKCLEIGQMDQQILAQQEEMEALKDQLETVNIALIKSEFFLNTLEQDSVSSVPESLLLEMFSKSWDLVNLRIALAMVAFCKNPT